MYKYFINVDEIKNKNTFDSYGDQKANFVPIYEMLNCMKYLVIYISLAKKYTKYTVEPVIYGHRNNGIVNSCLQNHSN